MKEISKSWKDSQYKKYHGIRKIHSTRNIMKYERFIKKEISDSKKDSL